VVLFGEGPYASSDFCETSVKYRSRTEVCMVSNILCTRAKSKEKITHGNKTKISAYVFKRSLSYIVNVVCLRHVSATLVIIHREVHHKGSIYRDVTKVCESMHTCKILVSYFYTFMCIDWFRYCVPLAQCTVIDYLKSRERICVCYFGVSATVPDYAVLGMCE
jgi:hypothetical protein